MNEQEEALKKVLNDLAKKLEEEVELTEGIYIQPKNTMPEIKFMYAFVSVDPEDENEGIIAEFFPHLHAWLPLVAADDARVEQFKPIAKRIAQRLAHPVRLVKFTTREVIEEYTKDAV